MKHSKNNMKYLILVLLLLILPISLAVRIDLDLNQSYSKDGRNVTLIDLSKEKALVCINNEKAIVSLEKSKTVQNVNLVLKKVYKDKIKIDIKVYCKDCKCGSACNNEQCINLDHKETQQDLIKEEIKEDLRLKDLNIELIQNNNDGISISFLISILFFIILIIIMYYLIRK